MKEIDKIAWIEIENGKILSTKSKGRNKFYIPGGKRDKGETDEETLIREIKEELNVDIILHSISYYGTFSAQADRAKEGIMVRMTCYKANYKGKLQASSEIDKYEWLDSSHNEIISEVDKIIFNQLKKEGEIR